jgi:colanic acid/amylovoran biosynthesis glycosyltransferase
VLALSADAAAPLRVAYLCSLYPAVSHTFVLREVQELRRRGVEVHTFSIHRAGEEHLLCAADRDAHATTFTILPPDLPALLQAHLGLALRHPRAYLSTLALALRLAPDRARGLLWQLFYFAEAVLLWRECSKRGIRHIHAHMGNVAADGALLAAELGSRVEPTERWTWSMTLHGPDELFDVGHFRLAQKAERAAFVVCISDFTRSQLMAICPPEIWPRFHVIHVGIPIEQFTRGGEDPRPGFPTILFVGRHVPQKGHRVLLDAFALLAARSIEADLVLAGDGHTRADLEAYADAVGIADRVRFLGAVGQQDIRELYAQATVFCLPSFAEGLPTVLMEAMAMELPVISTRINGAPELVRDGETGLLVTAARADELAHALERLIADPSLCRALGRAGREAILRDFDVHKCAAELQALLQRSLAAGNLHSPIGAARAAHELA